MTTVLRRNRGKTWVAVLALAAAGCDEPASADPPASKAKAPPTDRIDVPRQVRDNLGIEFVEVARRRVATTSRLPARVELLPDATHEYRAPLAGRVTLVAQPLQRVAEGDVLYELDSADWRNLQRDLDQRTRSLEVARAQLAAIPPLLEACEVHERSLSQALEVTDGYLSELQRAQTNVGGQSQRIAEHRVQRARLEAQIAEAGEKHIEIETRATELRTRALTEEEQIRLLLHGAAASLGIAPAKLADEAGGQPHWRTIATVQVRASAAGIVERIEIANGGIVERHGHVVVVVDPTRVRCRARALQGDLEALRDDLPAQIVPAGTGLDGESVPGTVRLGPVADPRTRTLDVFVTPGGSASFLRPGTAVFVEIETSATARPELAIPAACVLQDGLERVFFRRDPNDPNKAIRVVADLGKSDGRWIEIRSGLTDGDQVVGAGAFELVLASSQSGPPKGGHFHADGTWHEDH